MELIYDLEIIMDIGFYKNYFIYYLYQYNEDFVRWCEMDIMNIIEFGLSLLVIIKMFFVIMCLIQVDIL